jgi:hypothetical protein
MSLSPPINRETESLQDGASLVAVEVGSVEPRYRLDQLLRGKASSVDDCEVHVDGLGIETRGNAFDVCCREVDVVSCDRGQP